MKRIFIPTQSGTDWQRRLAKPELHWKMGHSAMTAAACWEAAGDKLPPEISELLNASQVPALAGLKLLAAIPEWETPLPGYPLVCPICAGQMRLIAFITDGAEVCKLLEHIGVDSQAPRISPARGPPLWDDCDAQAGKGVDVEPEWDVSGQIAPDYPVDQPIAW